MAVIYEINPPKIPEGMDESSEQVKEALQKLEQRVSDISQFCDGIHITDSVLGTKRVSALTMGRGVGGDRAEPHRGLSEPRRRGGAGRRPD